MCEGGEIAGSGVTATTPADECLCNGEAGKSYSMADGKCFICDDTCSSCTPDKCTQCATTGEVPGFTDAKKCLVCKAGCGSCDAVGGCKSCLNPAQYFHPTDETCYTCGAGCSTCDADGGCTACKSEDQFFLASESKCLTCAEGCATCGEEGGCSTCKAGGFFKAINPKDKKIFCPKCLTSCKTCDSTFSCIDCKEGFKLNSFGVCASMKPAFDLVLIPLVEYKEKRVSFRLQFGERKVDKKKLMEEKDPFTVRFIAKFLG